MKIKRLVEEKTKDTATDDLELEAAEESKLLMEDAVEAEDPTIRTTGPGTTEVDVKLTPEGEPATKKVFLKIKNVLTDVLDQALEDAEYALEEENYDANCNVLITGLPGSSKTATVRNWCKARGCHLHYLDSKNPDIQLLTSGSSAVDRTNADNYVLKPAYSEALAPLERERSILFLDELNRQIKEYLRGSLLTLLADRRVAGRDEEGFKYFPNLLFTIAAINPPTEGDRGATDLNAAEHRRFYYHVEFNSEVPTTKVFFQGYYDNKLIEYAKKHSAKEGGYTAADIARINSFCLRQWLGIHIILDEDFHYTTMDEYIAGTEKGQIICQSTITELIDHSRGEVARLIKDVNASALSKEAKVMLVKIIERLVLPNPDSLRMGKAKELGIDLGSSTAPAHVEASTISGAEDDDDDVRPEDFLLGREDDEGFSDSGDGATGSGAIDPEKLKASKESDSAISARLSDFASPSHWS